MSATTRILDLLTDKGVYPYDYFDSFEKFDERQLPPKKEMSKLTKEHIADEEDERDRKGKNDLGTLRYKKSWTIPRFILED